MLSIQLPGAALGLDFAPAAVGKEAEQGGSSGMPAKV